MLNASPHYDRASLGVHESDLDVRRYERDCYRQLAASRAAVISLASHQKASPAQCRAMAAEQVTPPRMPVGCTGDCADGVSPSDCTCSHALAWRAPRQPRVAPRRRSRWGRVLRDVWRWLSGPTP